MQHEFPFASLDFPGRTVLYPHEIGGEQSPLAISEKHVYRLIESGDLQAVDISRRKGVAEEDAIGRTRRQFLRVPIESWHGFLISRMTVPGNPIQKELSTDQLRQHVLECQKELRKRGVRL